MREEPSNAASWGTPGSRPTPGPGAPPPTAEPYTFDRPIRYHLDYQTLRGHFGELSARRIVLTHMSGAMLARLADAEMPAAYDGMTLDL